ncbi:MAG: iron-sulfur cluster assembly scaffold protein [Candidatus Aminicenantes bacterium]|nr:iron-sulfur cluster assembly scaffold protein [Candidatus Aminicenantes bacterium]
MSKDEELEKLTQQLQEQIMEQARQVYTEKVIDLWLHPRNLGRLEQPDGYAKVTGSCGDTMEIFLKFQDDRISECAFLTDGCGATLACGSVVSELSRNKTFNQALASISAEIILKELGGLPEENVHCAQLASETLRRALADYLYQKKSPWKKQYRKI